MHDPFDLSDAVIRDMEHVLVTRHAPRDGRRCEYRKRFKPGGLRDADYWIQRENEFLLDFALKRLRHVVELSTYAQASDGRHTPIVESVVTYDAGLTIEDWLRVRAEYQNGETYGHPFKHAGLFLLLLRACLMALREIHQLGIVHCDIKPDNICLPYLPYPRQPGQPIRIDFDRIRLIDFAFSITPDRPLQHPLPIAPEAPYQSNLLRTALRDDSRRQPRAQPASQKLDYRVDLYGLGHLAGRIADLGLVQPGGPGGTAAMEGALDLVERLQAFDDGRRRTGRSLPHDELIDHINALLEPLKDLDAYRLFDVARVREARQSEAVVQATPLTPLARIDSPPAPPPPRRRRAPWPKLPLVLAGLSLAVMAGFGYWQANRAPTPTTGTEAKTSGKTEPKPGAAAKPNVAATAKAKPEAEAVSKPKLAMESEAVAKAKLAEAEAKRKAQEQTRWKEEAEAMFKAELARTEQEALRREEAEVRAKALAAEAQAAATKVPANGAARSEAAKPAAGAATARINFPAPGDEVERVADIRGTLSGLADGQSAFLVIRSTAAQFGRLYYPQRELPRSVDWTTKGVFGTANYEYQVLVVATDDPESAALLRATRSRNFGLKELPGNTRVISRVLMVRRVR
ncbi:hypothetical protein [Methylomagnum sp.]